MIENIMKKYFFIFFMFCSVIIFLVIFYGPFNYQSSSDTYFGRIKSLPLFNEDSNEPLHVFIDLGANKGDSIYNFIGLNSQAQGGNLDNSKFPKSFKFYSSFKFR